MSRCYTQITLADRRRLHHLVAAKPDRRTDFMNDQEVIAKRQKALARMEAAE